MSDVSAGAANGLVLYHSWASTCSQKVRLALAEKNLGYESRIVDLRRFEHVDAGFLRINPDAMVPVLIHSGFLVKESSVVNEYLDDVFPAPPLRPADARGRARVGMWTRFIDDVTSPAIKKPSFHANLRGHLTALDPGIVEQATARMPNPATAARWRTNAGAGFTEAELAASHADLRRSLDRMSLALRDSPWLAGDDYSLADVDMAPFVNRIATLPGYALAHDFPAVADWFARLRARPAFAAAGFVEQRPDGHAPVDAASRSPAASPA